jgi:predicted dehydrogenase
LNHYIAGDFAAERLGASAERRMADGGRAAEDRHVDREPEIGVAMLGHGFMGRAHSYAIAQVESLADRPVARIRRHSISGRSSASAAAAARRYGWSRSAPDWRQQVSDDRVDVLVNVAPNDLHCAASIGAVEAGKHVLCEKPLAPDAAAAEAMARAARDTPVVARCAFNYRFFPAIQRARLLIEEGALGRITHFRSRFLQSTGVDGSDGGWRTERASAGGGVLRDLASHHIDLARHLVGEPDEVLANVAAGPPGSTEHAVHALVRFSGGGSGTIEASSIAGGHLCTSVVEVDGTRGSLRFDLERMNELWLSVPHRAEVLRVTCPDDPFMGHWFPAGHGIGWGASFVHMWIELLTAIGGDDPTVAPTGATFDDGYRCAEICAAIERSARSGASEPVRYRR